MAHLDPIQGVTVKDIPEETTFFSRIKNESKQKVRRIRRQQQQFPGKQTKQKLGINTDNMLTDSPKDIFERFKR